MKNRTCLFLVALLLTLAAGCGAAEPSPTALPPLPTLAVTISAVDIAQELNRGRLLVAAPVAAYGLEEVVPQYPPADLNALAGFTLRDGEGMLEAHIYVFADEARQRAGLALLAEAVPDDIQQPLWTTNGALLLYVFMAEDADLDAQGPVQSELLAALAGAG